MNMIAELAGSKLSYTDASPLEDEYLYQLEIVVAEPGLKSTNTVLNAKSNIVNTDKALSYILAEQINIKHIEEKAELSKEQTMLHLYTSILPVTSSYKNVSWQIISGSELATISQQGLLKHTNNGSGTVKVKATTLDGTNLSAEIEINIIPYDLDVNVYSYSEESGSVSGSGTYAKSSMVEVTAISNTGYKFIAWIDQNGNTVSTENPYLFNVVESVNLYAIFEENQTTSVTNEVIIENLDVFLYPNPARTGNTYLKLNDKIDDNSNVKIVIYSLSGEKVKDIETTYLGASISINISELINGIYLVKTNYSYNNKVQTKVLKLKVVK